MEQGFATRWPRRTRHQSRAPGAAIARRAASGRRVRRRALRWSSRSGGARRVVQRDAPGSALAVACDLRELETLPTLAESVLARWGRLDILVNNASTFYPTAVGSITPAQWDDLIGTNLRAPLFLAQACAPALRSAQGLIINMIDIHGQRPLKTHTVYSVAKAGLAMLTKSLARELAPDVRVNGIAPGPVLWPETGTRRGS